MASPLFLVNIEDESSNTPSDAISDINTIYSPSSAPISGSSDSLEGNAAFSTGKAPSKVYEATPDFSGTADSSDKHLGLSDSEAISVLRASNHPSEITNSSTQPAEDEKEEKEEEEEASSAESTTDSGETDFSDPKEANVPNESSLPSEPLDDAAESPATSSSNGSVKPLAISFLQPSGLESSWVFGPPPFLDYMNTKYKAIQRKRAFQPRRRIVYEKKGTTGMAGQMIGVCDTLLLAVLHDRAIQSRSLPRG